MGVEGGEGVAEDVEVVEGGGGEEEVGWGEALAGGQGGDEGGCCCDEVLVREGGYFGGVGEVVEVLPDAYDFAGRVAGLVCG